MIQILKVKNASFNLSQYIDISSFRSGSILLSQSSKLTIDNCLFTNHYGYNAAVFEVTDNSTILILQSLFNNNKAWFNAVFKISRDSFFEITDCLFSNNEAYNSNSIG